MDDQTKQILQGEAQRAAEELGVNQTPTPAPQEPTKNVEPNQPEPAPQEPATPPEPQAAQVETPPTEPAPEPTPSPAPTEEDYEDYYPSNQFQFQQPQQQQPVQQPVQPAPQVPQQPVPQSQTPAPPPLDVTQFTDQYGNVDMAKFSQAIRQRDEQLVNQVTSSLNDRFSGNFAQIAAAIVQQTRAETTQQIQATETEKRGWDRTFAKYPQIKESKELRDQIHKMRLGEIAVTGKPVAPLKMADRYFAQIAQAREDGVRQAVETTKVQATAHLETANNTASEKGLQTRENWSNIDNRNRTVATNARVDILKQMLSDGRL